VSAGSRSCSRWCDAALALNTKLANIYASKLSA
jgi:hypothetical protein